MLYILFIDICRCVLPTILRSLFTSHDYVHLSNGDNGHIKHKPRKDKKKQVIYFTIFVLIITFIDIYQIVMFNVLRICYTLAFN